MPEQNLAKFNKQNVFLDALTSMGSIQWACERAQISRRTYYNWLKNEDFQHQIEIRKHFLTQDSVDDMVKLLHHTIGAFEHLVQNDDDSIRLKASIAVVKNLNSIIGTVKARDMCDGWIQAYVDDKLDREQIERERKTLRQLSLFPDPPAGC